MLSLGFTPELKLKVTLALICPVCEQMITWKRKQDASRMRILFGEVRYAFCASCGMDVHPDGWTQEYKRRYDRLHPLVHPHILAGVG